MKTGTHSPKHTILYTPNRRRENVNERKKATDAIQKKLAQLFTSLNPGDVLTIPFALNKDDTPEFFFSAVLRLGENGGMYVSSPNLANPTGTPSGHNPIYWDSANSAFVDQEGEVVGWSSTDITVERGEAMDIVEEYEKIPRVEEARLDITEEIARDFLHSPDCPIIASVVRNNEAGNPSQQLSLILDYLGLEHSIHELAALQYYIEATHIGTAIEQAGLTLIADQMRDESLENPPSPPPQTSTRH